MSYPELQQQYHENKLCHQKRATSRESNKNNNLQPYRNFSNMLTNENILKTMRDDVKLIKLQQKIFQN